MNRFKGLQAELEAAYKELNCVKMKLKHQEGELDGLRSRLSEKEDDYNYRYSKQIPKILHQMNN